MKNFRWFLLVILILNSCFQEKSKENSNIDLNFKTEIEDLKTVEKQIEYLEDIYRLDQKVRTDETKILEKYGYDSKEFNEAWIKINKTDNINLKKIETYLEIHGNPSILEHGKFACGAPWIVIHHDSNVDGARRRNFKYLYNAWKNKDLGGGPFAFYLNRFYALELEGF